MLPWSVSTDRAACARAESAPPVATSRVGRLGDSGGDAPAVAHDFGDAAMAAGHVEPSRQPSDSAPELTTELVEGDDSVGWPEPSEPTVSAVADVLMSCAREAVDATGEDRESPTPHCRASGASALPGGQKIAEEVVRFRPSCVPGSKEGAFAPHFGGSRHITTRVSWTGKAAHSGRGHCSRRTERIAMRKCDVAAHPRESRLHARSFLNVVRARGRGTGPIRP